MRIIKKKAITIAEVNAVLKEIPADQLNPIQKRVLDYASKFSKVSEEKARQLMSELCDKIGLSPEEAAEIINIFPQNLDELRGIVSGWKKLLATETLQRILTVLSQASKEQ
jgi:DNA-directed RNA polymerase subunit F